MPATDVGVVEQEIRPVPLSDIKVDETNVRHSDVYKDVDLLAESIDKYGLLQPVVLMGAKPPYRLIVGQRRFLAHKRLNRADILARFVPPKYRDDAKVLSLIENLQRVEVNYADIAKAVTHLWERCKDDRAVAKILNLHLRTVRDYLRIELYSTAKMKAALRKNPRQLKPIAKRALLAAQNDPRKAERLFFEIQKMAPDTQRSIANFGSSNPKASAHVILTEGKKPKVQERLVLALDDSLRGALSEAQEALSMDWVDIAGTALREWLADKGFLKQKP